MTLCEVILGEIPFGYVNDYALRQSTQNEGEGGRL
jgi:hypothetical protein